MRIALPAAIDPASFATHDPAATVVMLAGETMGTTWRVLYAGRAEAASAVRAAIVTRLAELVAALSHWEPASALCRFNAAPAGRWVTLPHDLARVVDAALRIAAASGGTFDPAIGALVNLWGYGPPGPAPAPGEDAIAAARARGGYRRLAWRAETRELRQPGGVALDLSGIAKGYAVDALVALLAARGIGHCLVEIGGELAGRGLRPDGEPWWVELERPPGANLPPLRVALHGIAVATSGTYVRGGHNLDPRTGRPAAKGVVSVSVIAPSAMAADALASAALVAFPDLDMLVRTQVAARLVVRAGDDLREIVTPALTAMLAA